MRAREIQVTEVGPGDLSEIVGLERRSWDPDARASEETILERFRRGHTIIGLRRHQQLIAKIAFSYSKFDPTNVDAFPHTFDEFSTQPRTDEYNACFLYNLDVQPNLRAKGHGRLLIRRALETAQRAGCAYGAADGRPSSYNGNDSPAERVRQQPRVRRALDQFMATGKLPEMKELMADRTLALYHGLTGCPVWTVRANFLPEDHPSGGFRVIFAGSIEKALLHMSIADLPKSKTIAIS